MKNEWVKSFVKTLRDTNIFTELAIGNLVNYISGLEERVEKLEKEAHNGRFGNTEKG